MSRAARHWAGGALWTTASSVVIGVLGLLAVTSAARSLGAADYGDFAFGWALFFGVGGVFAGLQAEVTRTLSSRDGVVGGSSLFALAGVLALPVALAGGCVAAAAAGGADWALVGIPIFVGLLLLAALTFVAGVLAADLQWMPLAGLMALDAVVRTVAVVAVTAAGATGLLPSAIAVGTVAWIFLVPLPGQRARLRAAASVRSTGFARRAVLAMAAAGCTSVVVNGLPALVALVRSSPLDESVAAELAGLVFIRSGLLLVVYGLRPVILRYFLSIAVTPAVLRRVVVGCVLGGIAYAVGVAAVGPWLLRLILGREFALSTLTAAWLAVGSAGLVLMVVLGLALLALDRHAAAALGWVAALVAALLLLAAAPTTAAAIVLAASASPWVGVCVHLVAAARAAARTRADVEKVA